MKRTTAVCLQRMKAKDSNRIGCLNERQRKNDIECQCNNTENDRQVIDGSGRTVDVYDSLQQAARSAFDYGKSCQENTINTTGDEEIIYMADSDE